MKMMPLALALAVLLSFSGCGQAAESTVQEPISSTVTSVPAGPALPAASYEDLTEEQLALFEETGKVGVEDVKSYAITMDSMEQSQNDLIVGHIEAGKLPANGVELFGEWKTQTEYYKQFDKDLLADNLRSENGGSIFDEPQPDTDTPPVAPDGPIEAPEQVEQQMPGNNNDSGVPLTPDEIKDAFEGMTDGSDGSGWSDMGTEGYDVAGWGEDSGVPLTPEEIKEAIGDPNVGGDGSGGCDMSTHGYDVAGW